MASTCQSATSEASQDGRRANKTAGFLLSPTLTVLPCQVSHGFPLPSDSLIDYHIEHRMSSKIQVLRLTRELPRGGLDWIGRAVFIGFV
jgi:hypothetical protein